MLAWLAYQNRLAARWLFAWLIVEYAIVLVWRRRVDRTLGAITTPERDLSLLAELLARFASEPFTAARLTALQASLFTRGVPPSRRIAQLRQYVSWLDSTRNQMFMLFAYPLLLPQLIAAAIDRWHAEYGDAVVGWLRSIGEIEALSALGAYPYEHPNDPFPTLAPDGAPVFEGDDVGHPLMPVEVAVPNDIRLGGAGDDIPHVLVISGSNMSGKSTLLRAVGVNTVLALAGAPVRAARLRISPLAIGATIRIEDSLQAGHSRFYSEILRIKTIVDTAREGTPLLFLLDEILHGTNSYDRRIGAEAIVRSLIESGAIGLVTTHDLALTELPAKLAPRAANAHVEDQLENGRMVFDYLMRPGVVQHSNPLALMRAIGLDV